MKLFLYNSLTKKKEEFIPINPKEVTMYSCGPTVYSYAHIGNMSAYLLADLIRRVLEVLGYEVKHVKNITDVGHLVSDADSGEDKLDIAARKEGKTPQEIAQFYTDAYIHDEQLLKIKEPFARPKATEYIEEMLEMVKDLMAKGMAYETSDGVYMDISKFPHYGELSGNTVEKLLAGARVEVNEEKKHPADFALWKKAEANHIMRWDSPWGPSFPGWHLECSAMAWSYFHDTYDIKTGGEDNIFPHHECEIVQTDGVYGKALAHYFVHKRFLQLNSMKMSKSQGNITTLSDLISQGYSAAIVRYALLSSHYRNQLNFQNSLLDESARIIERVNRLIQELHQAKGEGVEFDTASYKQRFFEALCDDLNTAEALVSLHELVKESNILLPKLSSENAKEILETLEYMNQILDVFDFEAGEDIPENVQSLLESRKLARENKDFKKSDELRDEIQTLGYKLLDTADGQKVEKI